MPARRVPGQQQAAGVDQSCCRLRYQAGKGVDGGRHIIEGPWPASPRLPGPAELGRTDGEAIRRERLSQWPGVGPVVGGAPEPAVQEEHQRHRVGDRLLAIPGPGWQPQVGHVILIWAIPNNKVRHPGRPGQDVARFRIGLLVTCRTARSNAPFLPELWHPAHSEVSNGDRREWVVLDMRDVINQQHDDERHPHGEGH